MLLELFIFANFAFLSLDIYVAHSINRFRHWAEWIPFWFSIVAALVLLPGVMRSLRQEGHWEPTRVGSVVGALAILVGIAGVFWHLDSHFFSDQTMRNLVYAAPFAAPLAYAGLGFLLLANRMLERRSIAWAQWVLLLALGGFVGNFALSVLDHAQNGFFGTSEWTPVAASALAIGTIAVALAEPHDRRYMRFVWLVLALEIVGGVAGFALHLTANLGGPGGMWENFLYGAPIFSPLLFPNLALLAGIAVWVLTESSIDASTPLETDVGRRRGSVRGGPAGRRLKTGIIDQTGTRQGQTPARAYRHRHQSLPLPRTPISRL